MELEEARQDSEKKRLEVVDAREEKRLEVEERREEKRLEMEERRLMLEEKKLEKECQRDILQLAAAGLAKGMSLEEIQTLIKFTASQAF